MIKDLVSQVSSGNDLSPHDMSNAMNEILNGTQNDQDIANFLKNLAQKGESDDELLAMLNKMEEFAIHISPNCQGKVIDVCGTGGDKLKTFNISTAASLRYFLSRSRGSQLGAWTSDQSSVISSRTVLETTLARMKQKFSAGDVPLPDFWGGFRVTPETIEFWQSQPDRLHDRFVYVLDDADNWSIERLAP